jgi:hypothetical protein
VQRQSRLFRLVLSGSFSDRNGRHQRIERYKGDVKLRVTNKGTIKKHKDSSSPKRCSRSFRLSNFTILSCRSPSRGASRSPLRRAYRSLLRGASRNPLRRTSRSPSGGATSRPSRAAFRSFLRDASGNFSRSRSRNMRRSSGNSSGTDRILSQTPP